MTTVRDIEEAIRRLSPTDLGELRRWFASFDAALWDERLETDAKAGRLDRLTQEALDDHKSGRCRDL
jgi:hypothetical protein